MEILQRSPSAAIEALRPRQVAILGRCQDHPCGGAPAVPRRARATAVGGASPSLRSSRNALPAGVDGEFRRCAVSGDDPAQLPKFILGLSPGRKAGAIVISGHNEMQSSIMTEPGRAGGSVTPAAEAIRSVTGVWNRCVDGIEDLCDDTGQARTGCGCTPEYLAVKGQAGNPQVLDAGKMLVKLHPGAR